MKTLINIFIFLLISSLCYSASITITKADNNDPINVCYLSVYSYNANVTGANATDYVFWDVDFGEELESNDDGIKVKWTAGTGANDYKGKITAELRTSSHSVRATATFEVTIKSILHLQAEIIGHTLGGNLEINPCATGFLNLGVDTYKLKVPGTSPEETVSLFRWLVPKGWILKDLSNNDEVTSDGENEIDAGPNVRLSYGISNLGGEIKVRGWYSAGCAAQSTKYSNSLNINRDPDFKITPSKPSYLCGDMETITFTLSSDYDVLCATYYWDGNPSSGGTIYSKSTGTGKSDLTASVRVEYTPGVSEIVAITVPVVSFPENAEPEITGPDFLCYGSTKFELTNLRPDYQVTWYATDNIEFDYSSSSGDEGYFIPISSGNGHIKATIVSPCNETFECQWHPVWVGTSEISGIDGPTYFPNYQTATFYPLFENYLSDPYMMEWSLDPEGNNIINDTGWSLIVDFMDSGNYGIVVRARNDCGWGSWYMGSCYVYNSYYMTVGPNPSSEETTISIDYKEQDESSLKSVSTKSDWNLNTEWDLEVYDSGHNLKHEKCGHRGKEIKINTQGWKDGMYVIRVKMPDEVLVGKLLVKHD